LLCVCVCVCVWGVVVFLNCIRGKCCCFLFGNYLLGNCFWDLFWEVCGFELCLIFVVFGTCFLSLEFVCLCFCCGGELLCVFELPSWEVLLFFVVGIVCVLFVICFWVSGDCVGQLFLFFFELPFLGRIAFFGELHCFLGFLGCVVFLKLLLLF